MNLQTEMMKTRVLVLVVAVLMLVGGAGCSGGKKKKEAPAPAPAVEKKEPKIEKSEDERMKEVIVMKAAGVVKYSEDGATFSKLEKDAILKEGYTVRTESDGKAVLSWFDGNLVKISPDTQLKIEKIEYNAVEGKEVSDFSLEKGRVYARSKTLKGDQSSFAVKTPVAIAGVRGTEFTVNHAKGAASAFQVVEGTITVEADNKVKVVNENQQVEVEKDMIFGEVVEIPDDIKKLLKEESLEIEELVQIIMILKEKREKEKMEMAGEGGGEAGEEHLTEEQKRDKKREEANLAEAAKQEESFNVLLVGLTSHKEAMLVMVSHVMPSRKRIVILNIPPDTIVNPDSSGAPEILTNLYMTSGEKRLVQAVEELTGLKMKNYVGFNAETVVDLINTVGGVEIEVEKDLYYADPTIPYFIDLKKGVQKLDGTQAAQYAKFKYDDDGMAGSIKRQIKVINGLAKAAASPGAGKNLPQMMERILSEKTMWSNIKAGDSVLMGDAYDSQMLSTMNIYTAPTLEVSSGMGVDYVQLDKEAFKEMMAKMGKI